MLSADFRFQRLVMLSGPSFTWDSTAVDCETSSVGSPAAGLASTVSSGLASAPCSTSHLFPCFHITRKDFFSFSHSLSHVSEMDSERLLYWGSDEGLEDALSCL